MLAGLQVLADDHARIVVQEAIHHHPVVAGEAAELLRREGAELGEVRGPLERRGRGLVIVEQVGAGDVFDRRLELDQEPWAGGMEADVEGVRRAWRTMPADPALRPLGRLRERVEAEHIRAVRAEPIRSPEGSRNLARSMGDAARRRIEDKQDPMRLDRAGDMDGLTIAGGEVEGGDVHAGAPQRILSAWAKPFTAPASAASTLPGSSAVSRSRTSRKPRQRRPVSDP